MPKGKIIRKNADGTFDVELASGEIRKGVCPSGGSMGGSTKAATMDKCDLECGTVTVNEYRNAKGLPRDERFADMTWPEYVAANAEMFSTKAAAMTGDIATEHDGAHEGGEDAGAAASQPA